MEYNIVTIPGDGIGPEVINSAVAVLTKVAEKFNHKFNFTEVYAGGCAIDKFGEPLPQETIDKCKSCDSVLLGAVGGAVGGNRWDELPGDKRPERALLGLRSELGLYGNLRPAVLYGELISACPLRADIAQKGIDIMVVRELTGGMYFGDKGRSFGSMGEEAFDTEKYSVEEVSRISKIAFDIAMQRNKKVTNVDKANVLESSRLWRSVVAETAKQYPEVELDHMYVDNASMQLIKNPRQFDVILTTNMFGDILSDEASMITGSIGMLPSASLGKTTRGMYEPIHGSAPDIAGMDIANPIATILSAAMMLKHSFKLEEESEAIETAIKDVLSKGYRTGDIYNETQSDAKKIGTKEMTKLIIENI